MSLDQSQKLETLKTLARSSGLEVIKQVKENETWFHITQARVIIDTCKSDPGHRNITRTLYHLEKSLNKLIKNKRKPGNLDTTTT